MKKDKKVLAIDFGTKRMGLAISYGSLAEPLSIIANDDQILAQLKKICDQEKINEIVVGISESQTADKTKQFVYLLAKNLELPITTFDETLSTHSVKSKLKNPATKKSKRRQPVDHLAAAEFLQEYLDTVAE